MQPLKQFCNGLLDSLAWWRAYYWIRNDPIVRKSILNNFRNSLILLTAHLIFSVGLKSAFQYLPISAWWIWFINDVLIYFLWAPPLYVVVHIFSFFELRDMVMVMHKNANLRAATTPTRSIPLLERLAQDVIRTIAVLLVSICVQTASNSAIGFTRIFLLGVSSIIESYQIHEYWWCLGKWTAFERLKKVEHQLSYHLGFGLSLTLVQYLISGKVGIITAGALLPFYVLAVLFQRTQRKVDSTSSIIAQTIILVTSTIIYLVYVMCKFVSRCCALCYACTQIDDDFF